MPKKSTPESFAKSLLADEKGCMNWTRRTHKDGYGELTYQNKYWLAHRLAWTLANGEIPSGMCVCHSCDNPACCNPDHLFLGTHARNMEDMKVKGRRKNINAGSKNGRAKLTEESAIELRLLYESKEWTQSSLAKRFGVSQGLVSAVIRRVHWKEN